MTLRLNTPSGGSVSITPENTASAVTLTVPASGNKLAVSDTNGYVYSGGQLVSPQTGFKNRIINGDMRIDQRYNGALITGVGNGVFMLDRLQTFHDVGTYNAQRNLNALTPPAGFSNYFGMVNTSASTSAAANYFNISTSIEGLNWSDFAWGTANAQPATLSFLVRSSIAGTYSVAVLNGGINYGYPGVFTINAANTWEYKTITYPGPTSGTWATDTSRAMTIIWDLGQGSNLRFTPNTWSSGNVQGATGSTNWNQTNGATFYITGVQLEKGTVATPFEFRSIGQELALCQRYFEALNPGNSSAGTAKEVAFSSTDGQFSSTTLAYKVTKRATPTITVYDLVNASGKAHRQFNGSGGGADVTVSITLSTPYGFSVISTGVGNDKFGTYFFTWKAESEL